LEPDYVTSRFNRFLKEKGLPHIRFHDLRHSSASLLINNGCTLKEVQEWLGQASSKSTEIYAHMLYESKNEMAAKVNAALAS
jgi:integrase